jgi:hypothetical protein
MGLAIAGLALSAIGTGVGMMGQMQQASAARASADYQAKVAQGNQQIALQNASFEAASGDAQAAIQQQKTRAEVGSELAAQGSSGVDINSPTAQAVIASKGEVGALDAQTIRSNAARQAYGYQTTAANYGNAESADISQGQNAQTAGEIGAGTGLLSGIGSATTNYANVMGKATGINSDSSSYIDATDTSSFSGSSAYAAGV